MMRRLLTMLAASVFLMTVAGVAAAGPSEDEALAYSAYGRADYATALRLFRTLAAQGRAYAQYNLGVMYRDGQGVPQNYAEALKLLRLAAEEGRGDSQNDLGLMYNLGKGVRQDYVEAVTWYRRAAEQGRAYAQYNLGLMYDSGTGVPKDYVLAYRWYSLSAAQGDKDALANRDAVAHLMTSAQIAEAQERVRDRNPQSPSLRAPQEDKVASAASYLLLGALFVIPIWLVIRQLNAPLPTFNTELMKPDKIKDDQIIDADLIVPAAAKMNRANIRALKGIGGVLAGVVFFAALVCLTALWIMGLAWVSTNVAGYVSAVSRIVFVVCAVILLPLALFSATRRISAYGFFVSSIVLALATWIFGFLVTLHYWDAFGVFVGIVMLGVGVVPIGMLAAALHADWFNVGQLALCLVITFGARMFAAMLATKIDRDEAAQPAGRANNEAMDPELNAPKQELLSKFAEDAADFWIMFRRKVWLKVGEHCAAEPIKSDAKSIRRRGDITEQLEPKYFIASGIILAVAGFLLLDRWGVVWGFWGNLMVGKTLGIPFRYVLLCSLASISWGLCRHWATSRSHQHQATDS